MPRYFFSCEGAQSFDDLEGTELPDRAAAQIQAIANAGEILRDNSDAFLHCPYWRMVVKDEAGQTVLTLNLNIER